jgi:hypothetical protein
MSKRLLNLIATVCFVVAAIAFYVTGPLWLGILFTVLVILSLYQTLAGQH